MCPVQTVTHVSGRSISRIFLHPAKLEREGCSIFNSSYQVFRLTVGRATRYPIAGLACPCRRRIAPKIASHPSLRRFMSNELRNFLALSYDELEQLNLKAKEQRQNPVPPHKIQEDRLKYLTDEKRIKAVTVLFSDLEGRLHMLDYDKKFLIKSS